MLLDSEVVRSVEAPDEFLRIAPEMTKNKNINTEAWKITTIPTTSQRRQLIPEAFAFHFDVFGRCHNLFLVLFSCPVLLQAAAGPWSGRCTAPRD